MVIRKVVSCENPAIKEVFCLIQGKPAEVNDTDGPSLEKFATKKYKTEGVSLENIPTFVMIPNVANRPTNPFWTVQKKWKNGTYVSRFGHRYLSIHRLCNLDDCYEKYEKSIRPDIEKWIGFYDDVINSSEESHPVDLITFGYINEIKIPSGDFTLDQYVHLLYQLRLNASSVDTMNALGFTFDLSSSVTGIKNTIKTRVNPTIDNSGSVMTIEVYSTISNISDLRFKAKDVLPKVDTLKDHAKDLFFSYVTDHVKDDIMVAKYD